MEVRENQLSWITVIGICVEDKLLGVVSGISNIFKENLQFSCPSVVSILK
jgi:hypothetical protein